MSAAAQRRYDRDEPCIRCAVDLSDQQVERFISEFSECNGNAKQWLVDQGISDESIGDCGELLRELAVNYVRGNGGNSYFWRLMVKYATTIAEEDRVLNEASDYINSL